MPLTAFDHVNLRTANLDGLVTWYCDVLGFRSGARPAFPFPGAWLYLGDNALIHLVGVSEAPISGGDIALEHFAFRATNMAAFQGRLEARGIAYTVDPVPGFPIVQINLHDPDGNHIHVDFAIDEWSGGTAG